MRGGANNDFVIPEYKYKGPPRKEINDPHITNNEKRTHGARKYENVEAKSRDKGSNVSKKYSAPPRYNKAEQYVSKPGDPIIDLKMYAPRPPPRQPKPGQYPHPSSFYPNIVQNPMNPMSYARNYNNERFGGPVFKEYNININGVSGDHVVTSLFYEDVLPVRDARASFNTVSERNTLYEYIRSIMFPHGDGSDRPIDNKNYNLLSHLKFMDMNPYNASRLSNNPYKGLPYGFLLYRSCYPIRRDERTASSVCSINSTGVNVRIYRLTEGAYNVNNGGTGEVANYDQWREMIYYDFVKEHIVRENKCPNFAVMYGYNITLNSNINFDNVNDLNKNKNLNGNTITVFNKPMTQTVITNVPSSGTHPVSVAENALINAISENAVNRNNPHITSEGHIISDINPIVSPNAIIVDERKGDYADVPRKVGTNVITTESMTMVSDINVVTPVREIVTSVETFAPIDAFGTELEVHKVTKDDDLREYNTLIDFPCDDKDKPIEKVIEDLTYAGKVIVALTEAPNYNIIHWARKKYNSEGNVRKMTDTGFRPTHVWESVIFQIMAGIYAMQKSGIAIRDFCLERNVFIKDVQTRGKVATYWKYRIDGIDYFVPNYGYVVLIDSNYRDFDNDVENSKEADKNRKRKLVGKIFGDNVSENDIDAINMRSLKCAMTRNTFGRDFINTDGIPPPKEILDMFSRISTDIDTRKVNNVGYYIRKHMTMFINNRVGTLLRARDETNNVMTGSVKDFREGEIVVMPDREGRNRFVVHVSTKDEISTIITRKGSGVDGEFIENEVPVSSLIKYSLVEPIVQNYNSKGSNMGEESILETYNL